MDIDVILGMVCGYGAEQLLIAVAVSVVAALIKRKAKLDLRRELAARLVFSLALAALAALIFGKNYGWVVPTASGALGLSYVFSNLVCKNDSPTAETFQRSVAPYLTDDELKSVLDKNVDDEQTRVLLKNLLKDGTPEEEIVFITDVVIALKKFV